MVIIALLAGTSACTVSAQPESSKASIMAEGPPPPPFALAPIGLMGGPLMIARSFPPFPPPPGLSPQAHCLDMIAREAGARAYLEARLNLTAAQLPLWQRVVDAANSSLPARRAGCAKLPANAAAKPPTLPQRLLVDKELMAARLQELMQIQPSMAALYESLSAEQRALLEPPPSPVRPSTP